MIRKTKGFIIMHTASMDFVKDTNIIKEGTLSYFLDGDVDKAYIFNSFKEAQEWLNNIQNFIKEDFEILNCEKTININKTISNITSEKKENEERTFSLHPPFSLCRNGDRKFDKMSNKMDLNIFY